MKHKTKAIKPAKERVARYKVGEDKKRDKIMDDLFAQIWNLNQSADRGPAYKVEMADLCNAIHNA